MKIITYKEYLLSNLNKRLSNPSIRKAAVLFLVISILFSWYSSSVLEALYRLFLCNIFLFSLMGVTQFILFSRITYRITLKNKAVLNSIKPFVIGSYKNINLEIRVKKLTTYKAFKYFQNHVNSEQLPLDFSQADIYLTKESIFIFPEKKDYSLIIPFLNININDLQGFNYREMPIRFCENNDEKIKNVSGIEKVVNYSVNNIRNNTQIVFKERYYHRQVTLILKNIKLQPFSAIK